MAIELRVVGPGFEALHVLAAGTGELVLGRDADCGVCLPDLQRNVSRRHLAVWNDAEELHFRVLSVVNGVEMPFGQAPPGARGVLGAGQVLKLADYSLTVSVLEAALHEESDPWAVFDTVDPEATQAASTSIPPAAEDDPFGDWGFQTTLGGGASGGGSLEASKLGSAGDMSPFFRGLGLDPSMMGQLSQGELESVGRLVRGMVQGLLDVRNASIGAAAAQPATDLTRLAVKANNPLKLDWPEAHTLKYLFGGRATSAGFINPERALRELIDEVLAHDKASEAAMRETLESVLREFEPAAIKTRLLGGGGKLFEGARAWEAYSRHYAAEGRALPDWVQRVLDRYFRQAYLRESLRIKRETAQLRRQGADGGER